MYCKLLSYHWMLICIVSMFLITGCDHMHCQCTSYDHALKKLTHDICIVLVL